MAAFGWPSMAAFELATEELWSQSQDFGPNVEVAIPIRQFWSQPENLDHNPVIELTVRRF
jgi:hypothetical protein